MGVQEEYDTLKRQRATTKGKFTRKVTLFNEGVDRGDHLSVLKSNYEEVLEAFKCLECKNDELINFVCDNNLDAKLEEEAQQYILNSERVKNDLRAKLGKIENDQKDTDKPKVKVKKFEPPKFEGNLRDYPAFKEDYKNLVKSTYGTDPYALKMCLSGEALQAVKGSEGNYEEMFQRLDDKFGNSRKIVDLVISDLKSLRKISDGDNKGFIKMVDQVEQCWLDLKNVNLSDELNTANVVSHIEKVLPSLQKREWVIKAEEVSVTSKLFPELLKFLQKERKVLEYMNSNVRNSSGDNKVTIHNINSTFENNTDLDLVKLVQKMGEDQQVKNKEFESCIVNLTEMVKGANHRTESKGEGCLLHNSAGHDLTNCYKFKGFGSKDRFEMAKSNGICFRCLRGYHPARSCKVGKVCDVVIEGQGLCNRNHHPLLHSDKMEVSLHSAVSGKSFTTLLNISTLNSRNQSVTVLWDSGSDISLITHSMAKKLGLKGKNINLSMIKVGNAIEHQSSKEYCVPLTDNTGKVWNVDAVGIGEVSARIKKVDLSKMPELFVGISNSEVDRPHGEIDMLIGANYSELLPRVVQTNKGLQLLKNQFGFSIRGRYEEITGQVNSGNHVLVRIHKLSSSVNLNEISIESTDILKNKLDKLFAIEETGIKCDPQCIRCMCRGCPGLDCISLKEEKELALIEEGLVYNEKQKCWIASYPWIKDPSHLKNNLKVANARLRTTENRLKKLGTEYARKYQSEIEDMISRGVARKLSNEEVQDYKGPVHYIHHHEVLKPESSSAPLRIVFNSSASYMGQKLNDFWAKGPDFLTLPISEWPIRQICENELPDRIGITMTVAKVNQVTDLRVINVDRFSDYYRLLRITCRIRAVFKCKSFGFILKEPTAKGVEEAELLWVKEMQKNMTDWEVRFKRLDPTLENGIIVVGQRVSKWLKENWNQENYMLIPANHPVTRLYVSCLHSVDHAGVETTLAKLQRKFWVPGARKIIKSIKNKCVICRKLTKKMEDQCMGQVRTERLKPAPAFYHTAVDLFGPLTIRDTIKKRTHGRAFGVIFNCLVARAVYLDLAEGYSTDDFLTTFRRFIAIRGAPKFMYSDKGTQLISASKKIESIGEKEGVTWIFNIPSDAPWYNGASEALIKSVKRGLCIAIGDSVLNFGELQTALFGIANLMNERPIGTKPGFSLEMGTYLCPNDLLLGRSSGYCPNGMYEANGDHKRRLEFIQKIVDSFWRKWQRDYFPSMLIRQKWHTTR